jgi:hypothetical protein
MQNLLKHTNKYTVIEAKSPVVYRTMQLVGLIYETLNRAYWFAERLILYL